MVMFLLSMIPITLAEEDTTGSEGTGDTEKPVLPELRNSPTATTKRSPEVTEKLRQQLQERLNKLPEQARLRWEEVNQKRVERLAKLEELKQKPEFKQFREDMNFKARALGLEKVKEAKEKFLEAKEKFKESRDKAKEAQLKFLEAKQNRKNCTENCEDLEAKTLEHAKKFLINTADSIIKHLEKVKEKIQASEDLTEEESAKMIAEIDAEIKTLEDAKAKVEAATTKEELKDVSKTILEAWKRIKNHARWYVGKLVITKHGGIIVKMKHLELRLQKVLEKMEENGKDTTTIQPLIDKFHTSLQEAEKNFELATAKFKEFKDLPEPKGEAGNKIIQEAQNYMRESNKYLKEAHQTLKEMVKAVKDKQGNEELEETTTEEAEEDLESTEDEDEEETEEETETD